MTRKLLLFLVVLILIVNSGFVLLFALPDPLQHPIPAKSQIKFEKSGQYRGGIRSPGGELLLAVDRDEDAYVEIYNNDFDLITSYTLPVNVYPIYFDNQWALSIGNFHQIPSSQEGSDNATIYRDLFILQMGGPFATVRLSLDLPLLGGVAPDAFLQLSYDGMKLVGDMMYLPYFVEYSYNNEESTGVRQWGMFMVDLVTQEVNRIEFQVDPKESNRAYVRGDNATQIMLFLRQQENNIENNIVVTYRRDKNILEEQSRQEYGPAWYGTMLDDNQPVFISHTSPTSTSLQYIFNFGDRATRAEVNGSAPLSVGLMNQKYFASFAEIISAGETSLSPYIEVIDIHTDSSVIRLPSNPLNYNSWFVYYIQGQGSQFTYVVTDQEEDRFVIIQQNLGFVYDLVSIRDQRWFFPLISNVVMLLPTGVLVYRLRFSQKEQGNELYPGEDSINP